MNEAEDFWDDEDGGFDLPDFIPLTDTYLIGSAIAPAWILERMNKQQIVLHPSGDADILIRGQFIRAHRGVMIAQAGRDMTMFQIETSH